jgi:hypothetical protein
MADCKEYEGITRAKLADLRKDLARQGVTVPEGDDVAVNAPFGIELQAIYDEQNKTLKICITDKPFYVPESQIWKIVDAGAAPYAGE